MGGMKISSDADLAALQLQYANDSPQSVDGSDDDDLEQVALEQQQQQQEIQNQQIQDDLNTNTGQVDGTKTASTTGNTSIKASLSSDTVGVGGASDPQTRALSSIQSSSLDAPTQKVAGLENMSVRDFDSSKRV